MNMTDSLGTIEKGKNADLVLLNANPLENISNTKRIYGVIVNGKYLSREVLDIMLYPRLYPPTSTTRRIAQTPQNRRFFEERCSPGRNRTCIKSLGNFYSIH